MRPSGAKETVGDRWLRPEMTGRKSSNGLHGLNGLPPKRITCERAFVRAYGRMRGAPWGIDSLRRETVETCESSSWQAAGQADKLAGCK